MNRIKYILTFVLVILFNACQQKVQSQLDLLEHFIESNPDSTYSALQQMQENAVQFGTSDRMHYELLRLRCQNILDLPFDSVESIQTVVDYYTSNGTYNEALLATYLLGRSYMESGNEPMAVDCFNKCKSLKPHNKEMIDYIQLSKVHSQLCEIYNKQNLMQFELDELSTAEKLAYLGEDSLLALSYKYLKVNPYYQLECFDSVRYITNSVREKYLSWGMPDKAADVLYMSLWVNLKQKQYSRLKQDVAIFEKESSSFDSDGNIEKGREIYYLLKGMMYEGCGDIDSAERQYRRLMQYNQDINNVEGAYKGLLSLYRTLGIRDSIGKYADLYCEANDSLQTCLRSNEISRLKAMYDYSEYKQKAEELEIQERKSRIMVTLAFTLLVFMLFCAIYIVCQYRKRKQIKINALLEEYDRILQMIEDLNDDKEEMIKNHKTELESIRSTLQSKGICLANENYENSIKETLLAKFNASAEDISHSVLVEEDDWQVLFQEMSKTDPQFMLLLRKSNVSDKEKKIATLIRLRFKDYQIKRIFDDYGSNLTNYKARINKKLFNQTGAKTLRRFIYEFK